MTEDTFEGVATTHEEAHALVKTAYAHAKSVIDNGGRVRITAEPDEDTLTLRQLRFIHGPVLAQISEQVLVGGVRYTKDAWKKHLKDLFIPAKFEMRRAPFVRDSKTGEWRESKRKVPVKVEPSLKDLTGRRRSDFIDQVLAHAATEWGVQFVFRIDEREAVRWRAPVRKAAPKAQEQREEVTA